MKTRARLLVGLLVSVLAATGCGSRLGGRDLEAANGILLKHATARSEATADGGNAATSPAGVAAGDGSGDPTVSSTAKDGSGEVAAAGSGAFGVATGGTGQGAGAGG